MNENLLHFIWKLRLFPNENIFTTKGERIRIISNGIHNLNSGPDFFNSKIEINNQVWAGNVEIHIHSSDWYQHNHELDSNYDSVILHVVWEHDVEIFRKSNEKIPTLELKNLISSELLNKYYKLMNDKKKWINCENEIGSIDSFVLKNWTERLFIDRLELKSKLVLELLKSNNNHWEATLFKLLAKGFGLKVNGESFLNFANSFDFNIIRKLFGNQEQLEALFFGQAALLSKECESHYYSKLKNEYDYLKTKFNLNPIAITQIQFFRLRPSNFPSIRLSQLVSLYSVHQNLFSKIIAAETLNEFYDLFEVKTLPFWETHYTFETESKKSTKKLTKSFIDLLIINTIIPLKFVYLKSMGKSDFNSLLELMEQIKPEKNTIISNFEMLKIKSENAFTTQALLHLKKEYCNKNLCLNCAIGTNLLKN
ncbi:DUF2851 family protein [Lutibacter citreus]|uniref:DUF2851 family protein n=1 Tax=Lutibacter citreus TaxID=2138210 RepID=UPI000DBE03C9|nr:DUF2851 family protein [Lutibacter citreus]